MNRRIALLMAIVASVYPLYGQRNYRFDGKISREVLENYLSRSITMTEIYRSPGNLDDDIRMLKNIGAKFTGRTIYLWGGEARINDPQFLAQGREMAARIHKNDPDLVLQAAVFEIVTEGVGQIPVPDWVFKEFGVPPETRNFNYSKMLFPDGRMVNHWRAGSSVPDIYQLETKMWFFFLSASYIDIGIEAIHCTFSGVSGMGCYADRTKNPNISNPTMDKWFDTTAFASPLPYSFGNGSRTEPNLRNPGTIGFDTVMSRWQPIRERMRLQFRAEMYNFFNHPNLGAPSASITSPTYGQITSKSGNRTMTMALRLEF